MSNRIDILSKLAKPFPNEVIKTRPTPGMSKPSSYVDGKTVIERLNSAGGNWSFEICQIIFLPSPQEPSEVIVQGKITLHPETQASEGQLAEVPLVKGDVGNAAIKRKGNGSYVSIGNDVKGAVTDCLKRCARHLGVALELYEERASDEQLTELVEVGAMAGQSKEDIAAVCQRRFGKEPLRLNPEECDLLIESYRAS